MHALATAVGLSAALAAQDPATRSLFDGSSLAGWRGDPAIWRVADGCIVGSTVGAPRASNTFLIWEGGEVADFEFTCEVRLEGDNNSGVQYRSRLVEGSDFGVAGYQCDVHPAPEYLGMLYEERGAGILCRHGRFVARDGAGGVRDLGGVATPQRRDLAQWHRIAIVARGNLVWHLLDGELVAVVQDDKQDAPRAGVLALQVHGGSAMTVWWRNLSLRTFPREELAIVPAAVAALRTRDANRAVAPKGQAPHWLWDDAPGQDEELFLRRRFRLEVAPERATLCAVADNQWRVWVNGQRVVRGDDWASPTTADVARHLVAGDNVIAVQAGNEGGPAGFALRLGWQAGAARGEVVSDAAWRCSGDDPDGWQTAAFDDADWRPARVLGAVGQPGLPWNGAVGEGALGSFVDPFAAQIAVPAVGLSGPMAKGAHELLAVPRALGSWVVLCADDRGRLYASDQAKGLYRIVPAAGLGEPTTIEAVPVDLDGCQGLCWFRSALYAVVNVRRPGLYRITDSDGDDRLDRVELLQKLDGGGEHGPHAVVPAPDGENLLVLCGNHTKLPELAASRVPTNWGEDRLLPKLEDPNGHAVGIRAPGGFVCLVDPDGKRWELVCCGFRNGYDLGVLPDGDVVAYDADMEWDMGLPWYRPTRLLLVQSGVDYGWRSGSNKWPADYPDAPPALCDLGPGSPTGVLVDGSGVLALDWTFGTAWSVAAGVVGGSQQGRATEAFAGVPLPLCDAVRVGERTFVLTGGRGLPSTLIALSAALPDAPVASPDASDGLRRQIEATALTRPIAQLVADLAGPPRVRTAARLALESRPVAEWRAEPLPFAAAERGARLAFLLALARQGEAADLEPVLEALGRLPFAACDREDRIAWLRVHALALLRLGPPSDPQRRAIAARLLPLLPSGDERIDADLAELLAHLDAPGLLDRAVPLLAPLRPAAPPPWAAIAQRNAGYGGAIANMLANMPPTGQIAVANALRTVRHGWTLEQRRALFTFLAEARTKKGGASYDGYLVAMIDAAWATCSPAEQAALADVVGKARADLPKFRSTPPKGPGRAWTVDAAMAAVADGLDDRDLAAGHNLFHATGCAACHYFAGEGGNHGPDLTSLGNKFAARDVLEAILEPNRVISDQYSGSIVTRRDGSAVFGRAVQVVHEGVACWDVMPAVADAALVRIPVADVVSVAPSPMSPMPAGLVDGLNADELRDLLAFLLSRGRK